MTCKHELAFATSNRLKQLFELLLSGVCRCYFLFFLVVVVDIIFVMGSLIWLGFLRPAGNVGRASALHVETSNVPLPVLRGGSRWFGAADGRIPKNPK